MKRGESGRRKGPLTISHENDDMAGTVPAFRAGVPFPAHHAVHCLESLLGISPCLQLVICEKGTDCHLT